jgi:ribosomal protein S18 acetylase RimI-like enzyme
MQIRCARSGRTAAGADLLARAFLQDPGACRLYPREGLRLKALQSRFGRMISRPDVVVHVAEQHGTEVGYSVWATPSALTEGRVRSASILTEMQALAAHPSAALRMLMATPALRRLESRFAVPRCHMLVALGVEPSLHGGGIGTALLSHGLEEADARRSPCYLETTNAANIDFYLRHGFHVAGSAVPPGSVRTIAMTRAPAGGAPRDQPAATLF